MVDKHVFIMYYGYVTISGTGAEVSNYVFRGIYLTVFVEHNYMMYQSRKDVMNYQCIQYGATLRKTVGTNVYMYFCEVIDKKHFQHLEITLKLNKGYKFDCYAG